MFPVYLSVFVIISVSTYLTVPSHFHKDLKCFLVVFKCLRSLVPDPAAPPVCPVSGTHVSAKISESANATQRSAGKESEALPLPHSLLEAHLLSSEF